MIFQEQMTFSNGGSSATLEDKSFKVTKGLVYRVQIEFPPGCSGLVHVRIDDGLHQLWPSSTGQFFSPDGCTIDFEDLHQKDEPPFELRIVGYNEDETYDHTITIRLGIVTKKIFQARFLPSLTYAEMLAVMSKEQELRKEGKRLRLKNPFSWLK